MVTSEQRERAGNRFNDKLCYLLLFIRYFICVYIFFICLKKSEANIIEDTIQQSWVMGTWMVIILFSILFYMLEKRKGGRNEEGNWGGELVSFFHTKAVLTFAIGVALNLSTPIPMP